MTFPEYLKSLGASDEDVKALNEGSFSSVARRAFEKMQSDLAAEHERADAAAAASVAYETQVNDWYNTKILPDQKKIQNEAVVAQAALAALEDPSEISNMES